MCKLISIISVCLLLIFSFTSCAIAENTPEAYAEQAIPFSKEPALSITSIEKGNTSKVTVYNSLDVAVDSITFKLLTYSEVGNISVVDRSIGLNDGGLTCIYEVTDKTIAPGNHMTYDLIVGHHLNYNTEFIGFYIEEYHTVDGKHYAYSPEQVYIYINDNSIIYPEDESAPDCMNDTDIARANTIKFGVVNGPITPALSRIYFYPVGQLIFSVNEGSIFDLAGIKVDDVIKSFDDIDANSGHAWDYAKLKMLEGEKVTIHYYRNGEEYTTEIAQNMDEILQKHEEDYKVKCVDYTYNGIARNPEKVRGEYAVVSGEVIQVLEDGNDIALRVNITKESWGYTDTIYVTYTRKSPNEDRILEDDIITIWGELNGLLTYESTLGKTITLPQLDAEYIRIDSLM